MWKCKNCSERNESNFDACWSCGHSRNGSPPKNEIGEKSSEPMLPNGELLLDAIESSMTSQQEERTLPERQEVVIVDVSIPFWSMVTFMVKWALASIPAIVILFLIFSIISAGLLGGIVTAIN